MTPLINKAIQNPVHSLLHLIFKATRSYWLQRYAGFTRELGLKNICFILSFDCDTDQDAKAAIKLHPELIKLGIKPVYAVPGQILEGNASIFKEIFETGGEFINHGYRRHTYYDNDAGEFRSCFFYDQMPINRVEEDIRLGHESIHKTLGVKPKGFRTPHFGTFQKKVHLNFLYSVLIELGYAFSTSTVPLNGCLHGPCYTPVSNVKMYEFPVTGLLDLPLAILDSWRFWNGVSCRFDFDSYQKEVMAIIEMLMGKNYPALINLYADPLHVSDVSSFVGIFSMIAKRGVQFVNYSQVIQKFKI